MAAAKLAVAHSTFQSFVVDGKDQGANFAVQKPSNSNNPILDVTSTAMICNGGVKTADQVSVAAGSKVTMQWHHNQGPPTGNDPDEPIAPSHKGPVMVYIAPAESEGKGAVWQKIYEDGFSGGKWGVDNFIANKGQITITLPNLKAGDYWIRPEMIGLHEATSVGKAQFYNGCGQIKVTGSGSLALPASGTDMTKAYSATDPGVKFDVYNSFTSYPIPGPAVWTGAGASDTAPAEPATPSAPASSAAPKPSATQPAAPVAPQPTASKPSATQPAAPVAPQPTASKPSATQPAAPVAPQPTASKPTTLVTSKAPASTGGAGIALYGRCGGQGHTGSTTCAQGTCKVQNPYYSQCV
ncbi:hypothetical protein CC80DRAFT_427201 [Byssothecium circinans]|uniref:AA9 family lytic polysaccharide monooxygenase n=1 Tax=Byssothecium circinans TaxID=147558 RepID=A0A6A5TCH5_9PLEO|nr:hypothetical protein CC80DRAFT_427201 [Byssothecium circinans]